MPAGKGHGTDVAYNVQVTVDSKHKLILDHEVTNDPTDRVHLATMAQRAKDLLGVKRLDAVADMGYYDAQGIKSCAQAGINTFIAKPLTSVNRSLGLFTKQDFHYDARQDCYRCPAGQRLTFHFPRPAGPGRADPRARSRRPVLCHLGLRLLPSQA